MTDQPFARCGVRGCPNPHPHTDRDAALPITGPLARRIAALHPVAEEDRRPSWLRNLTARDMTGALR